MRVGICIFHCPHHQPRIMSQAANASSYGSLTPPHGHTYSTCLSEMYFSPIYPAQARSSLRAKPHTAGHPHPQCVGFSRTCSSSIVTVVQARCIAADAFDPPCPSVPDPQSHEPARAPPTATSSLCHVSWPVLIEARHALLHPLHAGSLKVLAELRERLRLPCGGSEGRPK